MKKELVTEKDLQTFMAPLPENEENAIKILSNIERGFIAEDDLENSLVGLDSVIHDIHARSEMLKSISEKLKSLCEIANNIREINGFKWQATGSTIKITDIKKLSERLIESGISQDAITSASTISFKNACELAGKSETAFLEEFGDLISKEKKAETLKRTY